MKLPKLLLADNIRTGLQDVMQRTARFPYSSE